MPGGAARRDGGAGSVPHRSRRCILRGAEWAAIVGIALACLSALANFMWLPYQPVWAILIIALDVLIIWALATRPKAIQLLDS